MRSARSHRVLGAAALLLPLAALVAVVLVLSWRSGQQARAENTSGVNFSLSSTGCDSSSGPTTCAISADSQFTVGYNLVSLGTLSGYAGYDVAITWSGSVNYVLGSLKQQGTDVWPGVNGCGFPVGESALAGGTPTPVGTDTVIPAGSLVTACTQSTSATADSTFIGALMTMVFDCKSGPGTITLILGDSTDLTSSDLSTHSEVGDSEALTINCGAAQGTPTNTPPQAGTPTPTPAGGVTPTLTPAGGATPTPTRTPAATPSTPAATPSITPTPTFTVTPTPTRRPHRVLLGDVDGDLSVDARDALWVLWFDAQLVVDVPIPEAADVNGDDIVNATDALLILQFDAGVIDLP